MSHLPLGGRTPNRPAAGAGAPTPGHSSGRRHFSLHLRDGSNAKNAIYHSPLSATEKSFFGDSKKISLVPKTPTRDSGEAVDVVRQGDGLNVGARKLDDLERKILNLATPKLHVGGTDTTGVVREGDRLDVGIRPLVATEKRMIDDISSADTSRPTLDVTNFHNAITIAMFKAVSDAIMVYFRDHVDDKPAQSNWNEVGREFLRGGQIIFQDGGALYKSLKTTAFPLSEDILGKGRKIFPRYTKDYKTSHYANDKVYDTSIEGESPQMGFDLPKVGHILFGIVPDKKKASDITDGDPISGSTFIQTEAAGFQGWVDTLVHLKGWFVKKNIFNPQNSGLVGTSSTAEDIGSGQHIKSDRTYRDTVLPSIEECFSILTIDSDGSKK